MQKFHYNPEKMHLNTNPRQPNLILPDGFTLNIEELFNNLTSFSTLSMRYLDVNISKKIRWIERHTNYGFNVESFNQRCLKSTAWKINVIICKGGLQRDSDKKYYGRDDFTLEIFLEPHLFGSSIQLILSTRAINNFFNFH
jgi:hypothetical protein